MRTSDKVACMATRILPVALNATPPVGLGQVVAHGRTGSELTVLSLTFSNALGGDVTINCWVFEALVNEWFHAGAAVGNYQKVFEPGGKDAFVVPENMPFYLQCVSGTVDAGQCYVDCPPISGNTL